MSLPFDRRAFCGRIGQLGREIRGGLGISRLAADLGVTAETWANYEAGVVLPDHVLLRLLCLSGVDPLWLLTGDGEPYPAPTIPIILPL